MSNRLSKLLFRLAMTVESKERTKKSLGIQRIVIKFLCELGGLAFLTFGGFTLHLVVGCVVAGFSCFYLAWRFDDEEAATANHPNQTVYRG